uniref:Uncharacterized protein n=1 Tax=Talaromyces marneffei PM1 TaxID=1077442 RepID=A0A093USJ1_TALMA
MLQGHVKVTGSAQSASPTGLFPPYYPERNASLPESSISDIERRSESQASSKTASQVFVRDLENDKGKGFNPARRSSGRWNISHFLFDVLPRGWSLEYISCFISATAFVSIVVVLHQFDQHKIPSWPLGITLNNLLAFLTAIGQSTFVFPVVQGLSQMKWTWFMGKNRPLEDFERFDNASRGAWGSIMLLFSTKGRLSILLAAILIVTSAVTSTITQAVLSQDVRYVANGENATIYRMIHDSTDYTTSINQITGYMISAMYTSLNSTYNYTTPDCATGNCKWPPFGSLAVCVQTNDITDKLLVEETAQQCCTETATNRFDGSTWSESCTNCTQTGLSQNEQFGLKPQQDRSLNSTSINLEAGVNQSWSNLYTFTNESVGYNALAAAQIIYLNTTDAAEFGAPTLNDTALFTKYARAVEALFYMCVETYDVTTVNGTTVTNVTSVTSNVTWFDKYGYLPDGKHASTLSNRTFTVDGFNYSYYDVSPTIAKIISASLTGSYNFIGTFGLFDMTPFSYAIGTALYKNDGVNATTGTARDGLMRDAVDDVLSNTARGMTSWLRSFFASPVQGQNNVSESYVVVRWPYLIFLGTQVVLTIIFLIWIVLDSKVRKVDILKDSVLAGLLAISAEDKASLESRLDALTDNPGDREQMEKSSSVTLVKSDPAGQWNLSTEGRSIKLNADGTGELWCRYEFIAIQKASYQAGIKFMNPNARVAARLNPSSLRSNWSSGSPPGRRAGPKASVSSFWGSVLVPAVEKPPE